jgi:hypothetical protein
MVAAAADVAGSIGRSAAAAPAAFPSTTAATAPTAIADFPSADAPAKSPPPDVARIESYFKTGAPYEWDLRVFTAHAEAELGLIGQGIKFAWTKGLEAVARDPLQDYKRRYKAAEMLQQHRKVSWEGLKWRNEEDSDPESSRPPVVRVNLIGALCHQASPVAYSSGPVAVVPLAAMDPHYTPSSRSGRGERYTTHALLRALPGEKGYVIHAELCVLSGEKTYATYAELRALLGEKIYVA